MKSTKRSLMTHLPAASRRIVHCTWSSRAAANGVATTSRPMGVRAREQILIPERPFDIDKVAESIRQRHERGRYFSIIVVGRGREICPHRWRDVISQDMGKGPNSATPSWAALPSRPRNPPASKPARSCWGTSSAAAHPCAFDRVLATHYALGHRHGASRRIRLHGRAARQQNHFHLARKPCRRTVWSITR